MEMFRLSMERSSGTWFGCLTDDRDRLVASAFGSDSVAVQRHLTAYSRRTHGDIRCSGMHPMTHQMIELYNGVDGSGSTVLNTDLVSGFQLRVYRVLGQIPLGKVTTYGLIAKSIRSAPRAVGRAVGSNPWPLFVPCQRVVNANLTTGNYSMCGNLDDEGIGAKRNLLQRECVPLKGDKVDPAGLWKPLENID